MHLLYPSFFFFASLLPLCSQASLISSSSLTSCVVQGDSTSPPAAPAPPPSAFNSSFFAAPANSSITCSQQIVVALTVSGGQTSANQAVEAILSSVTAPNGTILQLAQPVTISISKSPIYALYPLTFLQSFNGRPYEVVINTNHCHDSATDVNPTCGWFLDATGTKVYDSQGFCCKCGLDATVSASLTGKSGQAFRTNLDCSLWSEGLFLGGVPASAHCLRFNETWYPTYRIGSSTLDFQLQINITRFTPQGVAQELLLISPTSPLALNPDRTVGATLVGDFVPYTALPVLTSKLLAIPQPPGAAFGQISDDVTGWLLLDPSAFSLDGSECNLVGSSFPAFNSEARPCVGQTGDCLRNQLLDLAEADAARVSAGSDPLHGLKALGAVYPLLQGSGQFSVALAVEETLNSLLTLRLAADDIRYLTHRSPGRIVSASVHDFTALTTSGHLDTIIENNGTESADYTVTSQIRSIDAGERCNLTFEVRVASESSSKYTCTAVLFDSSGAVLDSSLVSFSTNATSDFRGNQGGASDGNQAANGTQSVPLLRTCGSCGILNVICYVRNRCWTRFGGVLGGLVGLIVAIGVVICLLCAGLLLPCLEFCCCFACIKLCSRKREREREREREKEKENEWSAMSTEKVQMETA